MPVPICVLVGLWFFYALSWAVGALPGDDVIASGTAQIQSCGRDPVRMGFVRTCPARVELADVPEPSRLDPRRVALAAKSVTAIGEVSGRIPVEMIRHGSRSSTIYEVMPADRPHWPSGFGSYLFLVMLPGTAVLAVLGLYLGRFARRGPQAPPEPKDWSGVRRLDNGPKRSKRKRR